MRSVVILGTLLLVSALAHGAENPIDLLADRGAWKSWSSREEISPRFQSEPPALTVAATGNPDACGCWQRALPALKKGRRYRIETSFRSEGIKQPWRSVWAIVTRGGNEYAELVAQPVAADSPGHRLAVEIAPEEDLANLELRLYLAWAAEGRVSWSLAALEDVTDTPAPKRIVRLAAIAGRPKSPRTPADCLDFYCARLDEAGKTGLDLVCLPEVINTDGIETPDKVNLAEPIPGPLTARLAEKARQYKMYVAASLLERDGGKIYNTGVLIDRKGGIVGKYHKTHPTIGECLVGNVRPGEDFPVFETDFGRVGYMICFDNHYPEVARILAVKGADVILLSNMADSREKGAVWDACIRTRALDNQVHIVASVNSKGTCVVSPRGEILAKAGDKPGAIARAECDLGQSIHNYSGHGIGKRYLLMRRFDLFGELTKSYQEFR